MCSNPFLPGPLFDISPASPAVGDFYGTGIEIQAGFGPIGITEKLNWANYEQLLRPFFKVFMDKKK